MQSLGADSQGKIVLDLLSVSTAGEEEERSCLAPIVKSPGGSRRLTSSF